MMRYLAVLIWPVGMAVIFGAAYVLSRRMPDEPAAVPGRDGARRHGRRPHAGMAPREAAMEAGQIAIVAAVGAFVAFGVMSLLGLLVVYHGGAIDKPVFHWIAGHLVHGAWTGGHQVHVATAAMDRLTEIGNTWTTWGAAGAAAVCIAVASRDRRWLAPVVLALVIVIDHYTTLALRHEFHRLGPPTSPLGTYPSGGADRCIVFYGMIAYLLWREFSGRRATAIWAGAVVAALGFNEAFSRVYLSKHWLTDALSGLLYGALLLAGFIVATRLVAGKPTPPPAGDLESEARASLWSAGGPLA